MPDHVGYERFAFSADTKAALEAKGHTLEEMPYGNQIAAILVGAPEADGKPIGKNRLYGSIDPRIRTGNAQGY